MSDFNRTERKALLVAAGLIGLAALGRVAVGPNRADPAWIAAGPTTTPEPSSTAAPGSLVGDPGRLKDDVDAALRREERALTPLGSAEKLDPNLAPEEELRRLPGIGPTRARAIVEERARRAFESLEALLRVPGIGAATYARISPFLTVDGRAPVVDLRAPAAPTAGCRAHDRVDLNRATEAGLRALPGIGPALARRIVQSRETAGLFATPEALQRVSGIGPRLLERLRDRVCLSDS